MIVLIILVYILLVYMELVPLYRNKLWLDFWVVATLTFLSLGIVSLLSFGVNLPGPGRPLISLITSMVGK